MGSQASLMDRCVHDCAAIAIGRRERAKATRDLSLHDVAVLHGEFLECLWFKAAS